MLIDCPGCARSYHVSGADLGRGGRTVVCPRCEAKWHAVGSDPLARPREAAGPGGRPSASLDEVPAARGRFRLPIDLLAAGGTTLAVMALAIAWVGRESVVRALPRTAAIYAALGTPVNVVGLAFERVSPERLASSDVTIRGTMRNVAGRIVKVPRLAFEVRDATGGPLVSWSESAGSRTLSAGRSLTFASSPHRLPPDSRTVLVRFE